jgi:hypothetical protein
MTEPTDPDDDGLDPEGAEQLGDAGKRALDAMKAKLKAERQRIKELEPLAERARAADDAAKTQAQKDAEARAAVERERDEARLTLLKRDAADEAGLPKSWADRLRGNTPAELLADAKNLAKDLAPQQQQTSARPVPELRSGALPSTGQQKPDADAWIRHAAGR